MRGKGWSGQVRLCGMMMAALESIRLVSSSANAGSRDWSRQIMWRLMMILGVSVHPPAKKFNDYIYIYQSARTRRYII